MNHRDNLHLRIEALEERQMLSTVDLTATAASDFTTRIEENAQGFVSVDGSVDNNNTGFTGSGFANTANVAGNGVNWSVNSATGGRYELKWRYALPSGERPGKILINGQDVGTQNFAPTGSWTSWAETSGTVVNLAAGTSTIRLEGTNASALPNIDFLELKALDQPTSSNLAAGKPTSQSSTSYGGAASRAVDGNTNRSYGGGSVTHTGNEANAWWQVDLGENFDISQIEITNRGDNLEGRLANFDVFVSATDMTGKSYSQLAGDSSVFAHSLCRIRQVPWKRSANPGTGRYVRVQLAGSGVLSLAEVKVFGTTATNGATGNLAAGKPTSQSSTSYGGVASRAVDGNINPSYSGNSVTHTSNEANAWWQVDLGQNYDISQVKIANRGDGLESRLSNFDVFVSSTDMTGKSFSQIANDSSVTRTRFSGTAGAQVKLNSPGTGRYVRVQLAGKGYLSLAEVKVFGTAATNVGTNGNDTLRGGSGNDTLRGFQGDDRLYGEGGNDSLRGDEGNDLLVGGAGDDILAGRSGIDTAEYQSVTSVTNNDDGTYTVSTPGEGTDTISGIEFLRVGGTSYSMADAVSQFPTSQNRVAIDDILDQHSGNFLKALQAAVNQLQDTGGTIVLSSKDTGRFGGEYSSAEALFVTRARGNEEIVITTLDGGKAEIRQGGESNFSMLGFSNANNMTVRNVALVGQSGAGTNFGIFSSENFKFENSTMWEVYAYTVGNKNIEFTDIKNYYSPTHAIGILSTQNATMTRVEILEPGKYGFRIGYDRRGDLVSNIRIKDSSVIRPADDGLDFKSDIIDDVHSPVPLLYIDGMYVEYTRARGQTAAIDTRVSADIRNVEIKIATPAGQDALTGIRFRSTGRGSVTNATITNVGSTPVVGMATNQNSTFTNVRLNGFGPSNANAITLGGAGGYTNNPLPATYRNVTIDGQLVTSDSQIQKVGVPVPAAFDNSGNTTPHPTGPERVRLDGTSGADNLTGNINGALIFAGAGNDTAVGGNGNDAIRGEDGDDYLRGFKGNDAIKGGAGNDNIRGDEGDDRLDGGIGNDIIDGRSGIDTAIFNNFDSIESGGDGGYIVRGKDGVDRIYGIEYIHAMERGFPLTLQEALQQYPNLDGDTIGGNSVTDSDGNITVSSIAELRANLGHSNGTVRMAPGTYYLDRQASQHSVEDLYHIFLEFSGSDVTYDFTDVTIVMDANDLSGWPEIGDDVHERAVYAMMITGDNVVLKGLNFVLDDLNPSDPRDNFLEDSYQTLLRIEGNNNQIDSVKFDASNAGLPYGFGDIFGKGGGIAPLSKVGGIQVWEANNTLITNTEMQMKVFGHGIFIQKSANTEIRDSLIQGEVFNSTDIKQSPEYQQYIINGNGGLTDRGTVLEDEVMISGAEDGIRAYGEIDGVPVTNVTVRNTKIIDMRSGTFLTATEGDVLVENSESYGNEMGFNVNEGGRIVNSRGDAIHGPLYYNHYLDESNITADLTLVTSDRPVVGNHAVVHLRNENNTLVLKAGSSDVASFYAGQNVSVAKHWSNWRGNLDDIDFQTTGAVITNETGLPVILGMNAFDNVITTPNTSNPTIIEEGANNTYPGSPGAAAWSGPVTYLEAEKARRSSNAYIAQNHDGYTGLAFASGLVTDGEWVEFTIDVPEAGRYDVGLRYAAGQSTPSATRGLSVYVNGEDMLQTRLPGTDTGVENPWSNWQTKTESLMLNAGVNRIRYQKNSDDNGQANLDGISISKNANGVYQAESATLSSGTYVASNNAGYTGTGFVAGITEVGEWMEYTVYAPAAGAYEIKTRYSAGQTSPTSNRTFSVYVNGQDVLQTELSGTGDWTTWGEKSEVVSLQAGLNTIRFQKDAADSGWVNLDRLTVTFMAAQARTVSLNDFYAANGQDFKPAMQAAINALSATGGTIILDSYGTGPYNGVYNNRSGTALTRSSGTAQITIRTPDPQGTKAEIRQAADGGLLNFSGANNLRIENIKVVGEEGRSGENVTIVGSRNLFLKRIDSINSQGNGFQIVNSSDTMIHYSRSENAKSHGAR